MNGVARSAVLYHYPCPDGAFAALAAHLYFSAASLPAMFFPNTVYNPISARHFDSGEYDDIYLLDFVGPSGFVSELSLKAKSVTILDHHKTAMEMFSKTSLCGNVTKIIDMERSGATIAYDYFREKLLGRSNELGHEIACGASCPWGALVPPSEVKKLSQIYKYIEDADLWRWTLPDSKAFSSGLGDLNIEYNVKLNPQLFNQLLAIDPSLLIKQGHEALIRNQKAIDEALERSYGIALGNGQFGKCLAVNADERLSSLRSELGNQLALKSKNLELRGIGAVIYKVTEQEDGKLLKISLRSVESEDTTMISQAYGGGGHRNASSFMVHYCEFEKWKLLVGPEQKRILCKE